MTFRGSLRRASPGFTPNQRQHVSDFNVRLDKPQRQHTTFIVAIPIEHRETHDPLTAHDSVEARGRVVRLREINPFIRCFPGVKRRANHADQIIWVPLERNLLAVRPVLHVFESCTPHEVVIELNIEVVTKLMRRRVIVANVVCHKTSANRSGGFIRLIRQPFPIRPQLIPRVDGGHR
ncbi:hypothetical protein D9M72_496430 [compost metagenome]